MSGLLLIYLCVLVYRCYYWFVVLVLVLVGVGVVGMLVLCVTRLVFDILLVFGIIVAWYCVIGYVKWFMH